MKKVFIKTYGCQMNIRDSEFVKGIMLEDGFTEADSMESADVILFNSCSVRKHAEDRLFSNIANLKDLKKKKPDLVIGLIGCTAQNYKDKILEKAPLVDLVCGPGNEAELPGVIEDILKNRCPIISVDKVDEKRPELFPKYRENRFKAYVSIGEGCNNFCSYCIVPYVRGKERSRRPEDITREIKDLASRGFKEITLLGQNVNSYNGKHCNFPQLLEKINRIKDIERIRFMTSHPKNASHELFRAMRDLNKVCEHLHLPLQSGSDRILKLMNRGYSQKRYLSLAEEYKKTVPEGSITTDVIVGFPSEKEKDFNETVKVMRRIGFDAAFIFKYSPRPPAKSVKFKDSVSKETKEKRLDELLTMQCEISRERNEPFKGKVVEVLVDGCNEKSPHLLTGRTRTNKIVVFEGEESRIGKIIAVKIESTTPHTLVGRIAR